MKKILLFLISSIAFLFGSPELLKDTDDIVEIHPSHLPSDVKVNESKV